MKRILWAIVLMTCTFAVRAQQFRVRGFRQLDNDISAYISPVRDLNDEACALVKIVGGSREFAFSTPLGIVKRKNDVGEVWLYLPRGSRLITLKHPQWGVLRDYQFPRPLESRITYELSLDIPLVFTTPEQRPLKGNPVAFDKSPHQVARLRSSTPPRIYRPQEKLRLLLMATAGIGKEASGGLRIGLMRRHGAYISLQSDFHTLPAHTGECNRQGIPDGADGSPYYTGNTRQGRFSLQVGGIQRLNHAGTLLLYEGVGYGEHRVTWETANGPWLRNRGLSARGFSAEAGAICRIRRWLFSAGVQTIAGKQWEGTVGAGFLLF